MGKANYVSVTSDKRKSGAFIRCLLGGIIGWHYFYVGRYSRGILALCTANFFLIGWIKDLGTISQGRFQDNIGQYLRQ